MSIKSLSEYTVVSKYAHYLKNKKRRESWRESVARVYDMHRTKYAKAISDHPELNDMINWVQTMQNEKRILGAQRSLQFGGANIFKHELKIYNCLTTHINRARVFQETMYALLCGCGVGFSVQRHHIAQLPTLHRRSDQEVTYTIQDSIEGWSDAIGVLVNSYFQSDKDFSDYWGKTVIFDYSLIRPEGSLIAGQFKAPGPNGLRSSIEKITKIFEKNIAENRYEFKPIEAYDICMHISDAVLSGGVRRSATLCLFSIDDTEMLTAKTGRWYEENPQRGRSNNSVALLKGSVSREKFKEIMECTKQFGEPGFVWVDDLDIVYNPCCEIGMIPTTLDGRPGWQSCNLTEINGKLCNTPEQFYDACKASAIIGTLQAGYTNLNYLAPESKEIFEHEALLGCSVTGWMDNPEVLFNPDVQRKGAEIIRATNEAVATLIGIRPAARLTCAKPSGTTSCILGTSSGIHPHHAKRYIRRVQANKTEFCLQQVQKANPLAVEESRWSANKTDMVISFLCEVKPGSIVKNQLSATKLLDYVLLTQQNWVEAGTVPSRSVRPHLRHNVSNTITVQPHEWDDVEEYIYSNQKWFAGISLLSSSGDLDYDQAPFSTVLTPSEIVKEYGDGSVFASGLIVDGLSVFDNDLWKACSILRYGNISEDVALSDAQEDWLRRARQFASRYFSNDIRKMTYCLKHVSLWKTWCDIQREWVEIDWSQTIEEDATYVNADTLGSQACAGGKCDLF